MLTQEIKEAAQKEAAFLQEFRQDLHMHPELSMQEHRTAEKIAQELARIPGMKDILAAGKKPMNVAGADGAYESSIEVASCLAPKQADRKREILEASADGAIEQFAAALKAAL